MGSAGGGLGPFITVSLLSDQVTQKKKIKERIISMESSKDSSSFQEGNVFLDVLL